MKNYNQGVGYLSGSENKITIDSTLTQETTENNELKDVMKASNILELYDKFNQAGISAAIVWDLEDDILDEDIKLTRIEKKKYKAAQKQQPS